MGGVGGETGNLGKRLERRDRDEYALFRGAGGGISSALCEFGASGRARTKIGRRVGDLHKLS